MNKKINELIPKALVAIKSSEMADDSDVVDKEYKGYIASMGASIIQSGLIATLAFYSKNAEGSGAKRTHLLDAIFMLIENEREAYKNMLDYVLKNSMSAEDNKIIAGESEKILVSNLADRKIATFEKRISNALIALKLALRTFKLKKEKKDE